MGMSETILAAMIGAAATMTTALFQIFSAFKARSRVDTRPRRNTLRSILAILALMLGSAAGGFLYSELIKQRSAEDLHAMRQDLHDQIQALAESTANIRRASAVAVSADAAPMTHDVALHNIGPADTAVESLLYVPACVKNTDTNCEEASARAVSLCAAIPAGTIAGEVAVFAQTDAAAQPWEPHRVELDRDLGGAKFSGKTLDFTAADGHTLICVQFSHWSVEHAYFARLRVTPQSKPLPVSSAIVAGEAAANPQSTAALTPAN